MLVVSFSHGFRRNLCIRNKMERKRESAFLTRRSASLTREFVQVSPGEKKSALAFDAR